MEFSKKINKKSWTRRDLQQNTLYGGLPTEGIIGTFQVPIGRIGRHCLKFLPEGRGLAWETAPNKSCRLHEVRTIVVTDTCVCIYFLYL